MSLLPSCREVTEGYARGDFEDAGFFNRLLVRAHVWHCDMCTRYLAQLRMLGEVFRNAVAPEPAVEALKSRLKQSL